MQSVPQAPAAIGVGPTWAATDNFSWRYAVTAFLVQSLDMDEGFVRVLADVTHLGPSNMHFKILRALAVELKCSTKDVSIAKLQAHWRKVNQRGAPRRGVRLLQHADADWFEDALEDFVNEVADHVPLNDPSGKAISWPWGDLVGDHQKFPDAGKPPDRRAFSRALEQVLLFCTLPWKEYRESLQVAYAREAGRLSAAQASIDKAHNDAMSGKKWTDMQLHAAMMKVQRETGIFLPNSLFNNLTALTAIHDGLKQPRARLSVSHHGKQRLNVLLCVGCVRDCRRQKSADVLSPALWQPILVTSSPMEGMMVQF